MLLRLFLPCLCFLCLPRYLYAQTVVHVKPDRNNIRVGDTVTLQLEVRYPSGIRSEWLLPDSMSHWEWLEKGSSRQYSSGATTTSMLTCRFTGYDTGYWPLPPIVLRTGNSTYRMDTPYIRVRYANRDLAPAFREMKPLMEVATDQPGISPWIIVLVVGLAASIFFYLLVYRNRIKDKVTGVDARSPADFIAQLRMLEDAYLRAELSEQAFYDKWHAILISFLEWKMAWTTPYENARQLMGRISELELPDTMRDEVRESIMIAERVRFGQYRPGSSLIERSLQVMKKLFENM